MNSSALIREALNRQPCPACNRRTILAGWLRPTRTRCMACGHRAAFSATIVKRRGRLLVAFGERIKVDRQYGGHRAW